MKKIIKIIFTSILTLSTIKVSHAFDKNDMVAYVGLDSQFCKMCFSKECGGNLFKKRSIGANPHVGLFLSGNSSIEIGYQYLKSSKIGSFSGSEVFHIIPVPPALGSITLQSSYIIKAPYIAFSVFTNKYENIPFRFFASAGLSHATAKFLRKTVQIGPFQGGITRHFEKTKTLRRFSIGGLYDLTDSLSLKGSLIFLNTGKLNASPNDGIHSIVHYRILPKNMVCYGLGLNFKF